MRTFLLTSAVCLLSFGTAEAQNVVCVNGQCAVPSGLWTRAQVVEAQIEPVLCQSCARSSSIVRQRTVEKHANVSHNMHQGAVRSTCGAGRVRGVFRRVLARIRNRMCGRGRIFRWSRSRKTSHSMEMHSGHGMESH